MFKRLQQKWGVNGINMALIISTFALGGSACARIAGQLLKLSSLEKNTIWWVIYIILVTILWPICVILISFPLGQFKFFKNYLFRIWNKITGKSSENRQNQNDFAKKKPKIAIFASGKGSNVNNIISYFKLNQLADVSLVVSDNPMAGVLGIAENNNIPFMILSKEDRLNYASCIEGLYKNEIDFIVLAGYLKKIPSVLIRKYPNKIINIHPALLPKYGGKGMYGAYVHQAVIENNEKESGITIHFVDEIYDHGEIIFQEKCEIESGESIESLATKVHDLEYEHFPRTIAEVIQKQNQR
jgi:formyltetrahydrofolate-dependent phosphoribosylglycinamide formyltransferase